MEKKSRANLVYSSLKSFQSQVNYEKYLGMIKLLRKVVGNIMKQPNQDKFRQIKKTNKVLLQRLFIHPQVDQALTNIGFIYDNQDQIFIYTEEASLLPQIEVILEAIQVEIESEINNQNIDKDKQLEIQRKLEKEIKEKEERMKLIQEQMQHDREDKQQDLKDHPVQGSKGKELKFGAKIKKCSEILPPPSR